MTNSEEHEMAGLHAEVERVREELAESQAHVVVLRAALEKVRLYTQKAYELLNRKELEAEVCGPNGGYIYSAAERIEWAKNAAREALAAPADDSTLRTCLKAERERCARFVQEYGAFIDEDGDRITFGGNAIMADAIRNMGYPGEVEKLK